MGSLTEKGGTIKGGRGVILSGGDSTEKRWGLLSGRIEVDSSFFTLNIKFIGDTELYSYAFILRVILNKVKVFIPYRKLNHV